jgi:hypothetical protein
MRPQGEEHMTKTEALRIIKLLSALESWAFSQPDRRLPDYLVEDVGSAMDVLERIVLEKDA